MPSSRRISKVNGIRNKTIRWDELMKHDRVKYGILIVILIISLALFAVPVTAADNPWGTPMLESKTTVPILDSKGICGKINAPTSASSYVMKPGKAYTAELTYQNTGSMTWSQANGIFLGPKADGLKFTPVKVPVSGEIKKGKTYTVTFTMTAPLTKGTYYPEYRMVQDGTKWFGTTAKWKVVVK
jgi:hypothetical protein